MRKLLTGMVTFGTFGLLASVAQAECYGGHGVTASKEAKQSVSISTHDGKTVILPATK